MFEFSVQAENSVGPGPFSPVRVFSTSEFGELGISHQIIKDIYLLVPAWHVCSIDIVCTAIPKTIRLVPQSLCIYHFLLYHLHTVPTRPRNIAVKYRRPTELLIKWETPECDYGVRMGYNV